MKKYNQIIIFAITIFLYNSALSQSNCAQPNYCSRICWSPSNNHPPQSSPTFTSPSHIIVHHSGDNQVWPEGTSYAAVVRSYWDLHVNTNGWSDIGYNWLIDRNGVIYEGRGDGVQGSHFSCMNSKTMGVCVIGNFNLETPSSQSMSALESLIAWEASDKDVAVMNSSYHSNSQLTLSNVCGHKDGNPSNAPQSCSSGTVCPGNSLYDKLEDLRSNINDLPCYSGGGTLDCSAAVDLSCGVTHHGGSSSANSNVNSYGCNTWSETGPERVHTITPSTTGTLTATISNFSGDLDVYILGSCDPSDCLGTVSSSSAAYSNAQAGKTYYIVVDADDGSGSSYDLVVNCPDGGGMEDITLSNETITSSTNVNAGETVDVEVDQNYSGNSNSVPNVYLHYYLSTDCVFDNSDVYLDDDFSSIDAEDLTDTERQTLTIPNGTNAGPYYILFVADATNVVAESNENNNTACVQITVKGESGGLEDITLSNEAITSSTTVNAGETVDAEVDQNYSGNSNSVPSVYLHYYLSTDCVFDNSDVYLDDDFSSIDAGDLTDTERQTLTIPNGTSAGTYYILFVADATNVVIESNENNNTACVQIMVDNPLSIVDYDFQNQISIYPIPTDGILNIKKENNFNIETAHVYDMNGRLVNLFGSNLNQLNITELNNGIYILHLISTENKKAIFRIIKE